MGNWQKTYCRKALILGSLGVMGFVMCLYVLSRPGRPKPNTPPDQPVSVGGSRSPWPELDMQTFNMTLIEQSHPRLAAALHEPGSPEMSSPQINQKAPTLYHAGSGDTGGEQGSIPLLVYNRVPKCGSTAVRKVLGLLAKLNHFYFLSSAVYTTYRLTEGQQEFFVDKLKAVQKPLLFERHFYFLNFTRFGQKQPPHFNVIRDPLDRMVSWYYFIRFQQGHTREMSQERRNMTFDQCVVSGNAECLSTAAWFRIIPFFCGQDAMCQYPSRASLAQAKANVEKYYLFVGITEDLPSFMEAAEYIIPQYFKSASATFHKFEYRLYKNLHTVKKTEPQYSTRIVMRARMAIEYEFYYFVKQRFYILMHNIHKMKYSLF